MVGKLSERKPSLPLASKRTALDFDRFSSAARPSQIAYAWTAAKSLDVNCTHCHLAGEWAKEDKPTKQITRDMAAMGATINSDQLKKIKNLKSPDPVINCATCHRGQTKPALNLPN